MTPDAPPPLSGPDDLPIARFAPAPPRPPAESVAPATPPSPPSAIPWYHHTWLLFLVLFGATAACGLPWLWKTPNLSRGWKWFWTVVVSLYTLVWLAAFAWVMLWCWRQFQTLPGLH
ncbi:MAG: hypothetical protein HYY93_01070 [Planctomycetes bacterium]|nr:hypothetical protein [Planctomycetota bacterium]